MAIKIFSENGRKLIDKVFDASNSNHKFIEIDASDSASSELEDILKKIRDYDDVKDFTIACPENLKAQSIQGFNVNVHDVTIIFPDSKYDPNNEENRKEFRDLIIKTDISYRNENFVGEDVIIHKEVAKENRSKELIAAAYKFIAFEYYDDEKGAIKDKYKELELGKIHSSFKDKSKSKEFLDEAKNAVCGGKYDEKTFNQVKKKSIYSGVDKFKASIDEEGYLVIQSVGVNIKDEYFEKGVKTNFKFEGFSGTEITQDNLKDLFTGDRPDGENSGLSVLGAIELAFQALKTIEKDNDGQLIEPNSSEQFNAIFPEYGVTQRAVTPELYLGLGAARKAEEERLAAEAAEEGAGASVVSEGSGVGKVQQQQLPIIEGEESAKRSPCGSLCPSTSPKPSTVQDPCITI